MAGVTVDNILNFNVTKYTARRLTSSTDDTINTEYTVNVHNADSSYKKLSGELSTNVENGDFTKYLQKNADDNGVSVLTTATSDSVTTENIRTNDDNDDNNLSDGAIAGIVIGSFFGFVIIVALLYYFIVAKKSTSSNTYEFTKTKNPVIN